MFVDMVKYAKFLCEGSHNTEYIRGQAELLAQFAPTKDGADIETTVAFFTNYLSR